MYYIWDFSDGVTTHHRIIKQLEGGARIIIPMDAGNLHYEEYLVWVNEGNTATHPPEAEDHTHDVPPLFEG